MENKELNEVRKGKVNKTIAKYEKKEVDSVKKTGIELLEQMKARKNREDIFRPKFDDYDEDDSRNEVELGKKIDSETRVKKKNKSNDVKKTHNVDKSKITDHKNNKKSEERKNIRDNNNKRESNVKKNLEEKEKIRRENVKKNSEEKEKIRRENVKKDSEEKEKIRREYVKKNLEDKEINREEIDKKSNVTDISEVERLRKEREKRNRIVKRQEKKQEIAERLKAVNYKRVAIIASIAAVIIILSFVMSFTMIKTTIIDEGSNYTKKEIENMVIDGMMDHNSIYLFLKYRYSEQEKIPFIEYIDVSWVNATTVKIKVYDKKIIGCTNYMNQFIYFDKDGLVIETSTKRQRTIPYITGLNFKEVTLHNKIKVQDDEIFNTILAVTQQISKYNLDIGEINFDKKNNITLYSGDITILLGKKETYDEQLAKLQNMLVEAKKKNLKGTLHMENYVEGQNRIIFNKNN